MGTGSKGSQISTVLVDEAFASQDDQFVEYVRNTSGSRYLASLADRWKRDPRPWARRQIFRYLEFPLDRPGHHPVVKRLFKQAEETGDLELLGAFLVAFDRLVRRQRRMRFRYDFQTRQSSQEEELFTPRNQIPPSVKSREAIDARAGERNSRSSGWQPFRPGRRLFSYHTRGYLRRRVWRYFRRLGFQRPAEYPQAVAAALALYRDDDFVKGENILDNWSLLHIAFRRSPALRFGRTSVTVADGRSLGELTAAPQFEELWKQPAAFAILLKLLTQAQARLVRVWTIQLLKGDHVASLQEITAGQLLELLDHSDDEVQQFGAGLLATLEGVDGWPIATWLQLLETRSVTALATITQEMSRRVNPQRLNLEQCVALACARATPVARLGLSWLSGRPTRGPQDRAVLRRLAAVRCDAIGIEATKHALSILGAPAEYASDDVTPFFDSLNAEVRRGAWDWLTPASPGYDDPTLWSRLLETPYDDVRLRLVEELNRRTHAVAAGPASLKRQDLTAVWTTVLLGIHRGGRAKPKALRQIAEAIADQPKRAEQLLPVLAVAIRSVRPSETRAGLSAILTAVSVRPELELLLARHLPELRLLPIGGTP